MQFYDVFRKHLIQKTMNFYQKTKNKEFLNNSTIFMANAADCLLINASKKLISA